MVESSAAPGTPGAGRLPRSRETRTGEATPEPLSRVAAQLKTLYQMGRDLGEDENWSDALDRFLMALVSFMGANGSGLLLLSDAEKSLSARAVFHLDDALVSRAIAIIRDGWRAHARGAEIHCLESYSGGRPTSCLERTTAWKVTVIPLRHRGRALGFLILEKDYAGSVDFQWDYHFLSALQTIFAEEIANASYISELRQLSRFNHKVLDNLRSGVVTTDLDGHVRYANAWAGDACPNLRTLTRNPVRFDDLFRAPGKASLFEAFRSAGVDGEVFEAECHGGRGAFPVRVRIARMHDDVLNGTVVVAIFEDLSEHKRMEEVIRRNDRLRALGQLSAGVAHEIRNPLAGIATTAEVLSDRLAGQGEHQKYTRTILDEVGRLDGIVRHLLAFARPPKPELAPCDVADVLARVDALIGDQARARNVELTMEARDVRCIADAAQLTQVLLNLALNAVQACGPGGSVRVEAHTLDERWVELTVTDNGPGIPHEVRASLFEPFVTTKTQGTGLGLAITRQIVEDHRGSVECTFLEPGTRFTVRLPVHTGLVGGAR